MNSAGRKTVLVGTIEYHVAGEVRPSIHTTPESRDLFELMAEGAARGATELVTEVSSHGLDQERAAGVPFDVAVFTNLTRDHLDYHGSMENTSRRNDCFRWHVKPPAGGRSTRTTRARNWL
jgi:UDP-N-acetylmuramoyl-L-alanyl-D-glutamate--2,6-diaminopimelate ligase